MERQRILERERRWARPAAAAAILAAPLYVVSVLLDQSGIPRDGLETERYRAIEAAGVEVYISVAVRGIAFLCIAGALLYLFKAAQARSERMSGAMVGFAFIGPVLLATQGVIALIAQRGIASDFVAQASAGGDVYTLLDRLIDESGGLDTASGMLFPAILGMLVAMIYIPLQAMRVGLLTRFLGTLGMALGAALIFIVPAVSLLTIVLWFLWLGLLFVDRTPGPRPPAWDAGVAVPWPRAGDKQAEEPEAERPEDVFEAGGEVAEGPGRDHSGRRERARKRKRRRRR